jgi:murein DD-endopeptidase MepM/ murein hydrolase activator NlpD
MAALRALLSVILLTLSAGPASAGPAGTGPATVDPPPSVPGAAVWPVAGARGTGRPVIDRLWEPPPAPWAAGHRGVDLATAAGATVRAPAAGRVTFAGQVAGRGVLTIELAEPGAGTPLRTTFEPVTAAVTVGEPVAAGAAVGELAAGPFHCAGPCLHWGLLRGETYLDPLTLLPPELLRRGPSRLLPTEGVPLPEEAGDPVEGEGHRAVGDRVG